MTQELMGLRTTKARLEAELEQLRVRLSEIEERNAALRAAERSGRVEPESLTKCEDQVVALRREIQRRKIALSEVSTGIAHAQVTQQQDLVFRLQQDNEATKRELDLLRREVRNALLGMTDLLRRQQRLAEHKLRLTRELERLSGQDYAYENYISCSLLHKRDYTGDVQFVVDTIKKSRPVS